MFQALATPTHSQSLSFSANRPSIPSSRRHPPRPFSVRCRAAPPNDFAGCLLATRNSTPASFYEVLKVKQNASPADIKTAYRRLAKIYHPDAANPPDLEHSDGPDFIQIHNAYETLSDPKSRAVYDRSINLIARRMVARSYASSSSLRRPGFYQTRRWESDQCW